MTKRIILTCLCLIMVFKFAFSQTWSPEKAKLWYANQGYLIGANFTPSTAVNQLEFWQADTFDPVTIERELGWAQKIGMNCMRVYLHHIAWQGDQVGFKNRINQYLAIAAKHGIKTMFVFFDDCWRDTYRSGQQPAPIPSVHNSQWLKDPGGLIDTEPKLMDTLEVYVKDIIGAFKDDSRILMWDLYNEPGHFGHGDKSRPLLKNVVKWAREINPSQPITIGIWNVNFTAFNKFQVANSDIITFHNYRDTVFLKKAIDSLTGFGRPMVCTEYMKRPNGSTFLNSLPILKHNNIGAINWGLVAGKTQTNYPQGNQGGEPEPTLWYHDIFRKDGRPFDETETTLIKALAKVPEASADGPYVFNKAGMRIARTIQNGRVTEVDNPKAVAVKFAEHSDWNFEVRLNWELPNQPSTYAEPSKIFCVSDIEGEFEPFRKLLIANNVIDKKYNWTFGKGHLVICGDLFDRGQQVTEELWLLYKLEQSAKARGGYVHVILGNHDIMNLSGDTRYVHAKYYQTADLLGVSYKNLFDANSELGKWLRTKNIIERVGNKLFVHGGIAPEVLSSGKTIRQINELCKPYYDVPRYSIPEPSQVFFGSNAPFWYRGYFRSPRVSTMFIDSMLKQFGCKQIIVGHTILARNIAMYYGSKVIGIDVDYHLGYSGAALFQNNHWQIANSNGKKTDLIYKPQNDIIKDDDIL